MSRASLNLYASEGEAKAWFVTAGDSRVCAMCQDAQDNSSYPVDQAPEPGLHPFCRCALTVNDPEPFKALAAFLA